MEKNIKLLVSDFDGVMTDNMVYVDQDGREMVRVSRADGQGINLLREMGIETMILSTEDNKVVSQRAKKLKIECSQGIKNKAEALKLICKDKKISFEEVAYVGNDVNDFEALQLASLKIVPCDAYEEVKAIADVITESKGGEGVIREIATIMKQQMEAKNNGK